MTLKRGDMCYILENNYRATKAKVVNKQGTTYIVQLIGSCGAMRLPENKIFVTETEAMASKKTTRAIVSPQISVASYINQPNSPIKIPDVFEGKRNNRSPYNFEIQQRR